MYASHWCRGQTPLAAEQSLWVRAIVYGCVGYVLQNPIGTIHVEHNINSTLRVRQCIIIQVLHHGVSGLQCLLDLLHQICVNITARTSSSSIIWTFSSQISLY